MTYFLAFHPFPRILLILLRNDFCFVFNETGMCMITFPEKNEIQRSFRILPDETKINHSGGGKNIDLKY